MRPIVTSSVRRIPIQCLDPRIKSLNYLNNIMAKLDARRAGALEAVMLNHQGRVAECTADNLFFLAGGVLKTPDLMNGALPGITRATVLEIGRDDADPHRGRELRPARSLQRRRGVPHRAPEPRSCP